MVEVSSAGVADPGQSSCLGEKSFLVEESGLVCFDVVNKGNGERPFPQSDLMHLMPAIIHQFHPAHASAILV